MSDKSNEQISNLMDGELEVNASKFLLKRMASDDSLSQKWDKYHLIKSCLQKEKQEPLMVDVASRVTAQLIKDSNSVNSPLNIEVKPKASRLHKWLKPVMGLGIAASVAFMSVLMIQNQGVENGAEPILNNTFVGTTPANSFLENNISASATVVASGKTILPPPSLSRFPSLSAKNTNINYMQNVNTPYLIIINQSTQNTNKHLSPIRIEDISD